MQTTYSATLSSDDIQQIVADYLSKKSGIAIGAADIKLQGQSMTPPHWWACDFRASVKKTVP